MTDRPIAANAHANRLARNAARADVTTPLAPPASVDVPAPDEQSAPQSVKPAPLIVISTQVVYRGRIFTLTADPGMSLNEFCDLLDRRFGVTP